MPHSGFKLSFFVPPPTKILDQLRLKSKTEQSMAKAHIYFFWGGGGHRTETVQSGKWGHCTYLLNRGTTGVGKTYIGMGGTPHILF